MSKLERDDERDEALIKIILSQPNSSQSYTKDEVKSILDLLVNFTD